MNSSTRISQTIKQFELEPFKWYKTSCCKEMENSKVTLQHCHIHIGYIIHRYLNFIFYYFHFPTIWSLPFANPNNLTMLFPKSHRFKITMPIFPTFFLLQLNPTYMKRILHLVSVKNITFKSSYNWFKIDIHQQLWGLKQ